MTMTTTKFFFNAHDHDYENQFVCKSLAHDYDNDLKSLAFVVTGTRDHRHGQVVVMGMVMVMVMGKSWESCP